MGLRSEFALHHSGYEAFLFAPLWQEGNGSELSVLSALARLGLDPWKKAAELAGKSKTEATESLAAILRRLPTTGEKPGYARIAERAVELLPRESGKPSAGAPAAAAENPLKKHAALVVLLVATFAVALMNGWLS